MTNSGNVTNYGNMTSYEIMLFDLDGTLTDPKEGITKSVHFALQKMGYPEPQLDELTPFIGPPLLASFQEFYGMDRDTAETAVQYYREYFQKTGMYENQLYPEIPELLLQLQEAGGTLIVATSKATVFSEEILRHFQIDGFFAQIVGSYLDGTRSVKAEVVSHSMGLYPQVPRSKFVMIGDRKYDIDGANVNGIDSIGVTYGYGSRGELLEANPTRVADSVPELRDMLVREG